MLTRFAAWYRANMLNRDGRVVWWEHVYTYMTLPLVVGVYATRHWQTIWPTIVLGGLGLAISLWSWHQDKILHNTDDRDNNQVVDKTAKVPLVIKLYFVAMIVLMSVIVRQWLTNGHY
jgi:hypothetical protein